VSGSERERGDVQEKSSDLRQLPRVALLLLVALLILLAMDSLLYRVRLPVTVQVRSGNGALLVDGQQINLGPTGPLTRFQLLPRDSLVHEYQIDGTDSTNNFTLDTTYLASIASSPYYRFQAWMRDLAGTSEWRDLRILAGNHMVASEPAPAEAASVSLPPSSNYTIALALQRPETPMSFALTAGDGSVEQITLDRNNRQITVLRIVAGAAPRTVASVYFPLDAAPFAAMVADFVVRLLIWAIVLLLVVMAAEAYLAIAGFLLAGRMRLTVNMAESKPESEAVEPPEEPANADGVSGPRAHVAVALGRAWLSTLWRRLTVALHPVAVVALAGSLVFTAWIARVQFNAEPHVYDASAYLFAARVYASGHLWAATPAAHALFPGPFMLDVAGRRFVQYPPCTGVMLAVGVKLGVPWLVEPVLGTLALLATGLIAARLFDRRVATIAVLLGVLSPFYTYIAASYLSHTVAFFFLAWGTWALLRFAQGEAGWNLPLAIALFGMGQLTRDEVALLYAAIVIAGIVALSWRRLRGDWQRWIVPALAALAMALIFAALNLGYNALMTGDPLLSPRQMFFAGDHWGFGQGVGFYGQHTVAAGFVNVDELLTILSIDLFGWPFYLTLAFLAVPFLARRARGADWLMLAGFGLMTAAFIGYFYHGIYLGPRYLYETLPFLLILSARGIVVLAELGAQAGAAMRVWLERQGGGQQERASGRVSLATTALILGLLACSLIYFWPRQLTIYQNFTGLPVYERVNLAEAYHPPLHDAIVVTGDYQLYEYVFFPLNTPELNGSVIYALAASPEQYAQLRAAYPGRALYQVSVAPDGSVRYIRLAP